MANNQADFDAPVTRAELQQFTHQFTYKIKKLTQIMTNRSVEADSPLFPQVSLIRTPGCLDGRSPLNINPTRERLKRQLEDNDHWFASILRRNPLPHKEEENCSINILGY